MLKHAGMLEPQLPMTPSFSDASSIELQWRTWLQQESKNRCVLMQPFLAGVGPTRGLIFFGGVKISGLITLQVGLQLGHG
jgi:hypothetical protein